MQIFNLVTHSWYKLEQIKDIIKDNNNNNHNNNNNKPKKKMSYKAL